MLTPRRQSITTGQESVWDYPRPPKLEKVETRLRVIFNHRAIADTVSGYRVLETSHPPVYYLPASDVVQSFLVAVPGQSWCEFKGNAQYWSLEVEGRQSVRAAWSYDRPSNAFGNIAGHFAFYATRVDECWIGDERVVPQEGDFYGGWITSQIIGPFKGGPGSQEW